MSKLLDYMDEDVREILNKKGYDLSNIEIDVENPEVNIQEIAKKLNCKVNYKFLFLETGSYNDETKEIIINLFDPEYRQRFTLAHEIAHNLLEHEGISYRKGEIDEENTEEILKEREANRLASKILMPAEIVRNLVENSNNDNFDDRVKELAVKFNVSYIAMEYRMRYLKLV